MKYVKAGLRTYDAGIGPIRIGETYFVEDDKAERWVNAGIAVLTEAPPPTPPAPEPEPIPPPQPEAEPVSVPEEDEDDGEAEQEEEGDEHDAAHLRAEAHALHDKGLSERSIAQQLGTSRTTVHKLLAS